MRKKLVYTSAAITLLLVLSAVTTGSMAADYKKIGVQEGSTADYTFVVGKQAFGNNSGTMHLAVTKITNVTTVTVNYTYHFLNGTTHSSLSTGNISTGSGLISLQLTAANLTVNDPISIGSSWKINATAYRIVAGANRTLNHFYFADGNVSIFWDKPTGMMTEIHLHWGPLLGWQNLTMTSTNLWSPTGGEGTLFGLSYTTWILIGATAIVVIAIVVVLLRRRK